MNCSLIYSKGKNKIKINLLFRIIFKTLLILKRHIFGRIIGYVWVIEFQKRGLPHCHMLLVLDTVDKPKTISDIDRIVSAEIPDPVKFPAVNYN